MDLGVWVGCLPERINESRFAAGIWIGVYDGVSDAVTLVTNANEHPHGCSFVICALIVFQRERDAPVSVYPRFHAVEIAKQLVL